VGTGEILVGLARNPDHFPKLGFVVAAQLSMPGPSASHPDEDSDTDGHPKGDQRAMLDLARDSRESIIADLGAEFGCIMAETERLVLGHAPAAADLVAGRRCARRGTAAGAAAELLDLVLERVQAALEGGDIAIERRCTMVKHGAFPLTRSLSRSLWSDDGRLS
jgi:hypothetical protein